MTSVAAVLTRYPAETISYVTDPFTGISASAKFQSFMPNPGEVKAACEEHCGAQRYAIEFAAAARKQLSERNEMALGHSRPRKTYEQIVEEFAAIGIFIGPKGSSQPPVDVADICEKYGVSKEQWDAIPTREQYAAQRKRQGFG